MSDFHPAREVESPRERLREARRLALLEAAEQVFAEKGYAGARMAEIAARAGYAAGSVYNSFEGKEDLFRAVVAWRGGEALDRVLGVLDETEALPAAEMLDRFIETGFSFWGEHLAFFRIYEDVTHGLDWNGSGLTDAGSAVREQLETRFEARLELALERGELAPGDAGLYTGLVFGTLNRAIARWVRLGATPAALEPLREPVRQAIRRALGVES